MATSGMQPFNRSKYQIPQNFPGILKAWTKEVLRYQPDDIVLFSRDYFANLESGSLDQFFASLPPTGLGVAAPSADSYAPSKTEAADALVNEELPDLNSFTSEDTEKIIKMQSLARGYNARSNVSAIKADKAGRRKSVDSGTQTQTGVDQTTGTSDESGANEAAEDFGGVDINDPNDANSVVRIQSLYRGNKARTRTQELKASRQADEAGKAAEEDDPIN